MLLHAWSWQALVWQMPDHPDTVQQGTQLTIESHKSGLPLPLGLSESMWCPKTILKMICIHNTTFAVKRELGDLVAADHLSADFCRLARLPTCTRDLFRLVHELSHVQLFLFL